MCTHTIHLCACTWTPLEDSSLITDTESMRHNSSLHTQGFQLFELIIVVAIIAIVTGIGIPNYNKFKRTAARNEAKALLSKLHIAQKQFNVEFGGGTTDLTATGFSPEGKLTYAVGFGTETPTVASNATFTKNDGACPYVRTYALHENPF